MISQDKINRINQLAKLSKERELTKEEHDERHTLRQEYLKAFRSNFKDQLHQVKVVDKKGNDVTPQKLKDSKKKRIKN